MPYDKKRVARRIRSLRVDKGYSQQQLSELSHVPLSTVRTYEYGTRVMSLENAAKIANALGCTIDVLACRTD